MIAVDTSVILAMALGEPEAERFTSLVGREAIAIGWPTLLESRMVLTGRGFPNASDIVDHFVRLPNVTAIAFDEKHYREAERAFDRFGKAASSAVVRHRPLHQRHHLALQAMCSLQVASVVHVAARIIEDGDHLAGCLSGRFQLRFRDFQFGLRINRGAGRKQRLERWRPQVSGNNQVREEELVWRRSSLGGRCSRGRPESRVDIRFQPLPPSSRYRGCG